MKSGRLQWRFSKRYESLRAELAEIFRLSAATRKREHGEVCNWLLGHAGHIIVEDNSYMANAKDANRFDQDFGGGWYEFGLGMNVNFTKNLYGYADFEYVTGGEIKTPYRWNAGVRYAF